MKRICKKCEIDKELNEYYLKKDVKIRSYYCKTCYNIIYKTSYNKDYYEINKDVFKENYKNWLENNDRSEYQKNYRIENAYIISKNNKKFRENNKEFISNMKKEYWKNLSPDKKEGIKNRKKELYILNVEKNRNNKSKYISEKFKIDSLFKLKFNIRSLIRNSLRREFTIKSKKTTEILGCSFEEFKLYLESKFDEKMNWNNQGSYWHMDHIKPISLAETKEEVYELNHYTNFQPMYWKDNLIKSDKF